jgi:NADH dehydrogenase
MAKTFGSAGMKKTSTDLSHATLPHVVIVGGGFGGLATAKALRNAPVRITLIDRRNHHLFQPLLYQVATAVLPPGNIAAPIRTYRICQYHSWRQTKVTMK